MPQDCKHHWILESPNGMMAKGVCKKCRVSDYFFNSISQRGEMSPKHRREYDREREKQLKRHRKRLKTRKPLLSAKSNKVG